MFWSCVAERYFFRFNMHVDFQGKSGLSDPIEYEAYILKCQSEINHDSLCDLLVFPQDDIVVSWCKYYIKNFFF